jgi:hypothetical protein
MKQHVLSVLSFLLVIVTARSEAGAQEPAQPVATGYSGQRALLSVDELQPWQAASVKAAGFSNLNVDVLASSQVKGLFAGAAQNRPRWRRSGTG